jgi:hypothetical protein
VESPVDVPSQTDDAGVREGPAVSQGAARDVADRAEQPQLHFGHARAGNAFPVRRLRAGGRDYGLENAQLNANERLMLGPPAPQEPPTQLDLFGSIRTASRMRATTSRAWRTCISRPWT